MHNRYPYTSILEVQASDDRLFNPLGNLRVKALEDWHEAQLMNEVMRYRSDNEVATQGLTRTLTDRDYIPSTV